jgi:5-methyltetrahydropteroyltriglutamate--homocysteine methyltransferase
VADDFKYHIDHAGGLVRPAALLDARRGWAGGRLDEAGLARVADEAIAEVAMMQRRIGLSAISDGQYRRATWASVLYDGVEGFGGSQTPVSSPPSGLLGEAGSLPDSPAVVAKLEATGRLAAAEARYLLGATQRSVGLALPAAGFVAERSFDPVRTPAAYSSPELVGAELAGILRTEIQALAADGVRHVQVANPGYALTISRAGRDRLTAQGIDPDGLLDRMATADLASIEALDTDEEFRVSLDITTGGAVDLTEGYDADAVARFFTQLPFYRVQVEHLAGADFPLTSVPTGRVMALGVIDVRAGSVPPVEAVLDRVDAATAILDVDDIAISTNGSFAPVADAPGQLSWTEQANRMQLVEMVARYYWGNEL